LVLQPFVDVEPLRTVTVTLEYWGGAGASITLIVDERLFVV
jgi:hypothetical protein